MTPTVYNLPEALKLTAVGLELRLREINLHFAPESRTIIVGKNGAGKSTLLKLMAGLEKPSIGQVSLGSNLLHKMSIAERANMIAWLPQRPHLDPQLEVIELMNSARFRFYHSKKAPRENATYYLDAMKISHAHHKRISQLSGGELQRVLLACLLAQEAPILLVDEPGNHLDPQGQLLTYQLLSEISRKEKKTLVIASHNIRLGEALELDSPGKTEVLGLAKGQISFQKFWKDSTLPACLSSLYGVPFLNHESDAPYAVDFQTGLLKERIGLQNPTSVT